MKGSSIFFAFIICFIISSCQNIDKNEDDRTDISYKLFQLEKRGWKSRTVTHFVNDIHYRATEVPVEYYFLKNLDNNSFETIGTLSKKHRGERILEVEFEHLNSKDLLEEQYTAMDYDKAVIYLSSSIQKDFSVLTSSGDTISCSGVLFERHFKVSPFNRVLLYFGGIPENETIQLLYIDRLFNNGIFKFKFNEIPFKT